MFDWQAAAKEMINGRAASTCPIQLEKATRSLAVPETADRTFRLFVVAVRRTATKYRSLSVITMINMLSMATVTPGVEILG